ncbi:hypothetical protein [Ramlibacter sp.]|uniref:hypothetical protein n=1 Tax=Ramlibacter sp. TaxID=1917967 RepID=UPI0017C1D94A|nr:hypothetical protein [Ramlibacter sp.]MBA2675428.1 hypothetical protein [Ramlibacter sp.]
MSIDDLHAIDWNRTGLIGWKPLLDQLMALAAQAAQFTPTQRGDLADALDRFANDAFDPQEMSAISQLSRSANASARTLRQSAAADLAAALVQGSAAYTAMAQQMQAQNATLKQQASILKLEQLTAATRALDQAMAALKQLKDTVAGGKDQKLSDAVASAIDTVKKLRDTLA